MAVAQEHPYGCGVACVAEMLGVSYADALPLFGPDATHKAETFGFYCFELCNALRLGGWRAYWLEVQPDTPRWTRSNAIVFLPAGPQYPAGHYLNREPYQGWNNSWINYPELPRVAAVQKSLPYAPSHVIFATPPRA